MTYNKEKSMCASQIYNESSKAADASVPVAYRIQLSLKDIYNDSKHQRPLSSACTLNLTSTLSAQPHMMHVAPLPKEKLPWSYVGCPPLVQIAVFFGSNSLGNFPN